MNDACTLAQLILRWPRGARLSLAMRISMLSTLSAGGIWLGLGFLFGTGLGITTSSTSIAAGRRFAWSILG